MQIYVDSENPNYFILLKEFFDIFNRLILLSLNEKIETGFVLVHQQTA
jgi:hypothetical protein